MDRTRRVLGAWLLGWSLAMGLSGGLAARAGEAHEAVLLTPPEKAMAELLDLAEKGVDLNAADADGRSPLHLAATLGAPEVVARLLQLGVAIDRPGPGGATPLLLAVEADRPEVVERLLKAGADPAVADSRGRTPATLAAESSNQRLRALFSGTGSASPATEAERLVAELLAGPYPDGAVVKAVTTQLARLGGQALPPVVAVLQDPARPEAQRILAANVLGALGRAEAVDPLLTLLRTKPHPRVARAAADAMARIAPAARAMDLYHYLRDDNPMDEQVRWSIYDALGAAGNPEVLPFLLQASRGEIHAGCRERAINAFDRITGPTGARNLEERVQWIRRNRPGWLQYFEEQTVTHSGYRNIAWFFVLGAVLAGVAVWWLWQRF